MENVFSSYASATKEGKARIAKIRKLRSEISVSVAQTENIFRSILNMQYQISNGVVNATKMSRVGATQCVTRLSEARKKTEQAAQILGLDVTSSVVSGYSILGSINANTSSSSNIAQSSGISSGGSYSSGNGCQAISVGDEITGAAKQLQALDDSIYALSLRLNALTYETKEGGVSGDMDVFRNNMLEFLDNINSLYPHIQQYISLLQNAAATYHNLAEAAIARANAI